MQKQEILVGKGTNRCWQLLIQFRKQYVLKLSVKLIYNPLRCSASPSSMKASIPGMRICFNLPTPLTAFVIGKPGSKSRESLIAMTFYIFSAIECR